MKALRLFLALSCCAFASAASAVDFCIIPCFLTPCSQYTWPTGAPPCDNSSTLQACVDNASSGDTVQIATNFPINESITVQKTLTLAAAQGFTPVFAAGKSITAEGTTGCNTFTIEGLTLEQGEIEVDQASAGSLNAQIVGNTIMSPSSKNGAIQLVGSGGAVGFDVSGNTITIPYDETGVLEHETGIRIWPNVSALTGQVEDNSIDMQGIAGDDAIAITPFDPYQVDVIGNRISGTHYAGGIVAEQGSAQAAEVRILDNLVIGQTGSDGAIDAIYSNTGTGTFDAIVANNTTADDLMGINFTFPLTPGAGSGYVANNIVYGAGIGISIDPSLSGLVPNLDNLLFANGQDFLGVTAGPGTIHADPLFLDAPNGNYHLAAGSPAIDAGDDASVPADLTTDLDGSPRIQGAHVDIGAYETAPEPDAQVLAVTGLVALLGLGRSRGTTAFRSPARRG